MDNAPTEIPVQPIAFAHKLPRLAQGLAKGSAKIVAIGSSSTAGEGDIEAYPERLLSFLEAEYPKVAWTLANKGIGGQEAPIELQRLEADVINEKPDLVIWQVGTNAVWQTPDVNPDVPSFDATVDAIRMGLQRLRDDCDADVILMDPQYVPAILTPSKINKAEAMVGAIGQLAQLAGINLFRRFEFMKRLIEVERVSFDRMVDPDDHSRLHQSDWVTERVAWAFYTSILSSLPGDPTIRPKPPPRRPPRRRPKPSPSNAG